MKQYLIIGLLTISLLLCGGFIIKMHLDSLQTEEVTSDLNKKLMEANLEIGRAESRFGNASEHVNHLEKHLKKEMKKRSALLTRYGELRARYEVEVSRKLETRVEIINTVSVAECTTLKLTEGQLYVARNKELGALSPFSVRYEDHRIAIGCAVNTRVTPAGAVPVGISYNLNLKLKANIVETITPTGAINNYVTIYELNEKGAVVGKFEIQKFEMVIDDQRTPKFLWWDPHMDIAVGVGIRSDSTIDKLNWEGSASLGFTPMSYGLSSKDLAWRFARFSFDLGQDISIGLTPVLYNIGNNLPVFTNLWVGPFVHYGLSDKEWGFGLSLGATL
jgi:hypothetical protein